VAIAEISWAIHFDALGIAASAKMSGSLSVFWIGGEGVRQNLPIEIFFEKGRRNGPFARPGRLAAVIQAGCKFSMRNGGKKAQTRSRIPPSLFRLFRGQMPKNGIDNAVLTFLPGPSFIRSGKFLLNPNG
jgi:hypothetical protein